MTAEAGDPRASGTRASGTRAGGTRAGGPGVGAPGGTRATDLRTHRFARLHHVQLAIPPGGEDRARPFYVGALGLTEVAKPPVLAARGGAWFRGDGIELHLGIDESFVPARKAHPAVQVANLDALAARLAASGVPVRSDDELPGHRHIYADDPFGNRLEFLEPRPPAR